MCHLRPLTCAQIRKRGGTAAEESLAYLWNSAERPRPRGRAFSGARVLPSLSAEAAHVACERRERAGAARPKHIHAPGAEERARQKRLAQGPGKRATARHAT